MSQRAFYVTSGPESMKAGTAVQRELARRNQWPYIWQYAPPESKGKRIFGSVAVPAIATPTAIVEFQVPPGMKFVLKEVVINYDGGGSARFRYSSAR